MRNTDVKISCFLAILSFSAIFIVNSSFNFEGVWKAASSAVTFTLLARFLFIKWIWKWKCLSFLRIFHNVPVIEGKWMGSYTSTHNDGVTGNVEVSIYQPTIFKFHITQNTGESLSLSKGEWLEERQDKVVELHFSYFNTPDASVRSVSPMSTGFATYQLVETTVPRKLLGNYFTDRKSTGKVILEEVKDL
ncbi:MAG: hypothetical protein V4598_17435 [Bdellovibrionota bacterium]